MTSETTLASLNVLTKKCDDVRSQKYKFYRELRSLIESQASEITTIKSQNERLVKALDELADAVTIEVNEKGAGGYLLARLSDSKALLAEIKPAKAS